MMGIDPLLSLYAIIAFITIGVGLTSIILFTKAKFVSNTACDIHINNDPSLAKKVEGGGTLLVALTSN